MKIEKPAFLQNRQTIGVTAPSFGCTIEPYITRFEHAQRQLQNRGYKLKIGKTVYASDGLGISTNPKIAAKELEEFYLNDQIDAIISAGGGETMCETVEHIDFEKLRGAKPKWFMGYSDNTNFIFPLATITGVQGIYGPCVTAFGKPWAETENYSIEILEGKRTGVCGFEKFQLPEEDEEEKDPLAPLVLNGKKVLKSFVFEGETMRAAAKEEKIMAEGIVLGGCLDVLANICGAKLDNVKDFNRQAEKIIWVIESCDANPMEIRRQVWHLKNAGWFDKVSAFVVGRPLASFSGEMMGVNKYNAVTDILRDFCVPVIMDADIGHVAPTIPLVIGANAKMNVCGNNISFDFWQ
ncbi:MAG: LD-carboxypeptidase [Treponemataceae bacterium]|nr:LD-carboxypeptidase [Treponemataceae bacterium]